MLNPLDDFRARLIAHDLAPRGDTLLGLAQPSIRLTSRPAADADLPLGGSKIGGTPDLPRDFEWPTFRDHLHSFLAQIDLAEVAPFDEHQLLPPAGTLSCFYEDLSEVWGYDLSDAGAWAVIFTPPDTELVRTPPPDPEGTTPFHSLALDPWHEVTLVSPRAEELEPLNLTHDEELAYEDVMIELNDDPPPLHRMLGNPDLMQNDYRWECQCLSHGISVDNRTWMKDPRALELRSGVGEWRLLFQLDSDDAADMMWEDGGRLYFWIHADDLAHHRFDRTRFFLESC